MVYPFHHCVFIHRYRRERQVTIPMKFHSHHLVHRNSATDRTYPLHWLARAAILILSVFVAIPMFTPAVAALSVVQQDSIYTVQPQPTTEESIDSAALLLANRPTVSTWKINQFHADFMENSFEESQEELETVISVDVDVDVDGDSENTENPESDDYDSLFDPTAPLTQELIARRMESKMNMQVRGGSKIYYPYPAGAMAVDLYKDGKQILKGQVADIGGTVYVPVQRFADLFGRFKTVYTEATEQVVITGTNLSITVKVGDPYITVNERIFYTGKKVISLGGWIFVPLTSMCKALNADVTIRSGYYDAFITSGDPTSVPWASEYYNSTDLYWLSRIISAEAKGEPFAGQIAVGNVVLNRVRSSQFPNTVKGVIFDTKYGTQFSPVSSGTIYNTPTESSVRAAKICLEGYSLSTKMIYFYNPAIATSSWIGRTRPYIMTIGNHKFYG